MLACRPQQGTPGVSQPRPPVYWPIDAIELGDHLLEIGRARASGATARAPRRARSNDWLAKPLPERRTRLAYTRAFSADQHKRMAFGLIPQGTDDRWFIYIESDQLFFHRGWTGYCIFTVQLVPSGMEYAVAEAWVNRDPSEYTQTDSEADIRLLDDLIEMLLQENLE